MPLRNRKTLITGAARGIGLAIAEEMIRQGAVVCLADIDANKAEAEALRLSRESGREAHWLAADVSSANGARGMVEEAARLLGGLDVLVNNAGILHTQSIEDTTEEAWNRVLAINLSGVFFACQAALPHLRRSPSPRIVNMASMAGRNGGLKTGLAYSASKGGVIAMSRGMARQLAGDGIAVNAVCPGTTESDIILAWPPETIEALRASVPMGRLGKPADVAAVVCFLASEAAGFVTGVALDVNGGMFIG